MNGQELMQTLHSQVVESGSYEGMEDLIDYFWAKGAGAEVTDMMDFEAVVNYGGNEGIYLDCRLVFRSIEGAKTAIHCGSYKTLSTHLEAAQMMGKLAGSLTYFFRKLPL